MPVALHFFYFFSAVLRESPLTERSAEGRASGSFVQSVAAVPLF
jgi:hypothetical protein